MIEIKRIIQLGIEINTNCQNSSSEFFPEGILLLSNVAILLDPPGSVVKLINIR
jgi:hypothetical protein